MSKINAKEARLLFALARRLAANGRDNGSIIDVVGRAVKRLHGFRKTKINPREFRDVAHAGAVNAAQYHVAEASSRVVDCASGASRISAFMPMLLAIEKAGGSAAIGITSQKWIEIFALRKNTPPKFAIVPETYAVQVARQRLVEVLELTHKDNRPFIGTAILAVEKARGLGAAGLGPRWEEIPPVPTTHSKPAMRTQSQPKF